ncbi:MAG: hypothetical protein DHS20C14_03770 [Phycisphaeraceae bacterium]|nr:MAG: hypothetical protein DHS20C14_03770 [Phycisphaeraceae bacterium]
MRFLGAAVLVVACLPGCGRHDSDGPPAVRLGDSVCAQCNMILSDDRFVSATVIDGPRGPEPQLFDDFNCQVAYEVEHAERVVLARWTHDYVSSEWITSEAAHFVIAPAMRTPMASHTAAFRSQQNAENANAELDGEVLTFEVAWRRLGDTGIDATRGAAQEEVRPTSEERDGP